MHNFSALVYTQEVAVLIFSVKQQNTVYASGPEIAGFGRQEELTQGGFSAISSQSPAKTQGDSPDFSNFSSP